MSARHIETLTAMSPLSRYGWPRRLGSLADEMLWRVRPRGTKVTRGHYAFAVK